MKMISPCVSVCSIYIPIYTGVCIAPMMAHDRYEETPEGQLRPQPPPQGSIFTGDKTSRVGPGQYDPSVGAVRPDPKAAVFGRGPEIDRTALLLGTSVAPGIMLCFQLTAVKLTCVHASFKVPDL